MPYRKQKVAELIKNLTARFLAEESESGTLITVTDVAITGDLKQVTVYVTVYPDDKREEVLTFVRRKRRDLHEFLKKNTRLGRVPHVTIEIDEGEKRRQRLDELSRDL